MRFKWRFHLRPRLGSWNEYQCYHVRVPLLDNHRREAVRRFWDKLEKITPLKEGERHPLDIISVPYDPNRKYGINYWLKREKAPEQTRRPEAGG